MLTAEQQEKARQALEKKKSQDREKLYAMIWRLAAYTDIYGFKIMLPFRILYDLHKAEDEGTFTEIFPNAYYPQPAISVKLKYGRPVYSGDTSKLPLKQFTYEGKTTYFPDEMADPEYKAQIEEYNRKADAEKFDSEKWGYWYARFLEPYDFQTFSPYDFWGRTEFEDGEEPDTENYRKLCIETQKDFREHPENYNTEPVERKKEHKTQFDVPYGYI